MQNTENVEPEFTFRIAQTPTELDEIVALIADVYAEQGYIDPKAEDNASSISKYLSLPCATVFAAYRGDRPVGTISVVGDSDVGLPMDVIYKDELDTIRNPHLKIAEVCQFAIDKKRLERPKDGTKNSPTDIFITTQLLGLAIHYGFHEKYDLFSFAINPKHRVFYEAIGCLQIGPEKSYPSVNDAPALAYLFGVHKAKKFMEHKTKVNWLLNEIFVHPPSYALFRKIAITSDAA